MLGGTQMPSNSCGGGQPSWTFFSCVPVFLWPLARGTLLVSWEKRQFCLATLLAFGISWRPVCLNLAYVLSRQGCGTWLAKPICSLASCLVLLFPCVQDLSSPECGLRFFSCPACLPEQSTYTGLRAVVPSPPSGMGLSKF